MWRRPLADTSLRFVQAHVEMNEDPIRNPSEVDQQGQGQGGGRPCLEYLVR